jgi:hypothetical protein
VSAKAMLAGELPMAKCTNRTPEALMQQVGFSSQLVSGWVPFCVTVSWSQGGMLHMLCPHALFL